MNFNSFEVLNNKGNNAFRREGMKLVKLVKENKRIKPQQQI
jgi:hypothetical protein